MVESELPDGVTLRDLGDHRLKDLRRAKHLYQLVIAGLPSNFHSTQVRRICLKQSAKFNYQFRRAFDEIGGTEAVAIKGAIAGNTGPGGSGKTRLALQVAAEMIENYPAGVYFVALAPITDPRLVASTIAHVLGLAETTGRSIVDSLRTIYSKSLLLVLDNFEQVISAAPLAADLCSQWCSKLKLLVTSREGLAPEPQRARCTNARALQISHTQTVAGFPSDRTAVDLFLQRAQAVRKPSFRITTDTAPVVAEICYRLDG